MRCANPNCRAMADELLKGTLRLVEFETPPDDRLLYAGSGFPVCAARTRYFWLCAECSRRFTITKWDSSGAILERHPESDSPFFSNTERKPAVHESLDSLSRADSLYGAA
jgi:hypothetical protein